MNISFFKYNGTGNDFVMIDNRQGQLKLSPEQVAFLCNRHFGIGADGLILLEAHAEADFKMVYYNSDGNESTMCGNGGRCIIQFAHDLKIIDHETRFLAIDGWHEGKIHPHTVALQMQNVSEITPLPHATQLDTGSPHYVSFMDALPTHTFKEEARKIRNSAPYKETGINVNFAHVVNGKISMRTFERGVEDETLSCGTGATAVAISAYHQNLVNTNLIPVSVPGGELEVSFDFTENGYENIWLTGPAKFVFEGKISL